MEVRHSYIYLAFVLGASFQLIQLVNTVLRDWTRDGMVSADSEVQGAAHYWWKADIKIFIGNGGMNFAQQQRDPRRHLVGLTTVVFLHAILIYALANGLARKVVEVLKKPLEVNLLSEDTPKAQPKAIPPPAYVPPPEVQVQAPPEPAVISIAPVEPPAPVVIAPQVPQVVNVGAVCPNHLGVLSRVQPPPQAQGLSGKVVIEFIVDPSGAVGDVAVVSSSNRVFNAVATAAVSRLHCVGQAQSVRVRVPFVFEQER